MINFKNKLGEKLTLVEAKHKGMNRIYSIFLDFELMMLRWIGHIPFHLVRLFFYRLSGIKIGQGSRIHMWANFFQPANIEIGNDTIIGDHAFLDGRAKLKIGNHVDIASSVLIYNSQHDIQSEDFRAIEKEIEMGDYVFIGPRAIILPGVIIGKGAVIAAGAVVTDRVEPYKIVGGIPAKVIGERKIKDLHYRLGRARLFQ